MRQDYDYLNYDSVKDRETIVNQTWNRDSSIVIFDELHKFRNWKSWIKGVYDTEGIRPRILVTGSAGLETFRKGGDSLAGRFFSYRLHPFTVREALSEFSPSKALDRLLSVGGFPEPFLKGSAAYAKRWRRGHGDVILREDLLDLERVREIKGMEILVSLLASRVGAGCSYSSLSRDLQVSVPTVKHWLQILENLCFIFPVRPWHKNISRSLLKEPKYFLYDTGSVRGDYGARLENVVACALLRELHMLEDSTGSRVGLYYLRDKEGREVDFLVVIDDRPVCMVEVKWKESSVAPSLLYFKKFFSNIDIYQIVYDLERKKSTPHIRLWPAGEYLASLSYQTQ